MAEVDSLEIRISASSEQAAQSIDKLITSMTNLKTALKGGIGGAQFKNLANNLRELGDAAKNVEGSIGALAKAAKAVERLSSIGKVRIPKGIGDGIRNVGLAAEMVTPQAVENLDNMTRSLQRLSNVDLKGVGSALRGVRTSTREAVQPKVSGTAPFETSTKGMSRFGALIGSDWKDLLRGRFKINVDDSALKKVGELAKTAWNHLKALGQKIRLKIEAATIDKLKEKLKGVQTIFRSLGRIAFYRAIRSAIKAVTQAFQEGLENARAFSEGLSNAVDGRIAVAMDSLSAHSMTMKNQLGAAFGSLLTALAPIISALIGLITSLATAITQLMAAFTGGTFLKARDVSGDLAKNMKAGGGAAKEWKNQLMGFDEINRLEDQNGGGGGGGSSGLNAADMFDVVPIDKAVKDFVDNLKDAFLNGKWDEVGKVLGTKINEIFDSVEWDAVGQKIGYWVDGIIKSFYYFLKEVDFGQIGSYIAELINAALEKIDLTFLGGLLIRKFTAAIEFFAGLLGTLNWTLIGEKIGDFLKGALDEATEWMGQWSWEKIGEKINEKLTSFLDGFDEVGVAEAINRFVEKAVQAAKDLFTGVGLHDIVQKISDELSGFLDALSPSSKNVLLAILGVGLISGVLQALSTVVSGVKLLIDGLPFLKFVAMAALVAAGIYDIVSGFKEWNETGELSKDTFAKILEGAGFLSLAIGLMTGNVWGVLVGGVVIAVAEIIKHWDEIVAWWHNTTFYQSVVETWDSIKKSFSDAKTDLSNDWDNLKKTFTDKKNTVVEFVVNLKDTADEWWMNLQTWWKAKVGAVEDFVTNVKDDSSEWWQNVGIWWENKKTDALEFKVKIADTAAEWWSNVKGWWDSISASGLWTVLSIKLPTVSVTWEDWFSVFGANIQYPVFHVSWNAKGGIVDGATLFGAGEAGAEAIIPLERNTEWIAKVAADLNEQQQKQPNYQSGNDNDDVIDAIFSVGAQIVGAIAENSASGEIDWRTVASRVTKYQNQMARAGA